MIHGRSMPPVIVASNFALDLCGFNFYINSYLKMLVFGACVPYPVLKVRCVSVLPTT